jgi:hypothetical protein
MTDPHKREAQKHLLRIQRRVAADAVLQQRALTDRNAKSPVGDLAQRILEAMLAHQAEPDPDCEQVLACVARGVEQACVALGLDIQKGVVKGVLPARGINAQSSDFYGTGIAIVAIDASLVPFTGMLAELLLESFEYRETDSGWAIVLDAARCLDRVTGGKTVIDSSLDAQAGRETLVHRWERFFLHFAGLSLSWSRPALTDAQEAIYSQLTSAMEVFAVGHEYGHHIRQHNAGSSATSSVSPQDALWYEFDADRTAWLIARYLGAAGFAGRPTEYRNTWMESSAGAVAYLVTAEVVCRVRDILETGSETEPQSLSHPACRDRLKALEDWDGFADQPLADEFRAQRRFLGRLIETIYWHLRPKFLAAHEAGFRPTHL